MSEFVKMAVGKDGERDDDMDMDEDDESPPDIPIFNVRSQALEKILEFCEHYKKDPMAKIAKPIWEKEMEKVVKRLADVDHPWNCPHGRPTMRHVGGIRQTLLEDERDRADYVTSPTVAVTPLTQDAVDADDENRL